MKNGVLITFVSIVCLIFVSNCRTPNSIKITNHFNKDILRDYPLSYKGYEMKFLLDTILELDGIKSSKKQEILIFKQGVFSSMSCEVYDSNKNSIYVFHLKYNDLTFKTIGQYCENNLHKSKKYNIHIDTFQNAKERISKDNFYNIIYNGKNLPYQIRINSVNSHKRIVPPIIVYIGDLGTKRLTYKFSIVDISGDSMKLNKIRPRNKKGYVDIPLNDSSAKTIKLTKEYHVKYRFRKSLF